MNLRKNPKILFLITKSDWGGAQKYVFDLSTGLATRGYTPVVITGGHGDLISKLQKSNIKTIVLPSLQRDISIFKELKSSLEIYKVIKEESPDILHVNSSKAGGIGALLGRLTRVPKIIFTAHGWAFNEDRNLLSKLILKTLHWITVLLSHNTIAVSVAVKNQMNWPGGKAKIHVIYNGLNQPDYYDKASARNLLVKNIPGLNKFTNDFWSVTIGELHKTKQHQVTIKALSQLREQGVNLRHIIIGAGEERESLVNLVNTLNLQNQVFFAGRVDSAARYLKAFDLFILSSISEALAYVVIEAAQAELPIIASKVGGIPEIITHDKEGTLVPSGDVDILSSTIKNYINNQEDSAGKARAAYLKSKNFSIEKMLTETTLFYGATISSN